MCISVFLSCPINWNLTGCRSQNLPPGGRGTAKRWMRNGDTFPFVMQSIQTVQPFPMYLFNEMHTDSEHIAVPHPPQCAHWGTFPPGQCHQLKHRPPRRRGRCPHRPAGNGILLVPYCGEFVTFGRADVGIGPYGSTLS